MIREFEVESLELRDIPDNKPLFCSGLEFTGDEEATSSWGQNGAVIPSSPDCPASGVLG